MTPFPSSYTTPHQNFSSNKRKLIPAASPQNIPPEKPCHWPDLNPGFYLAAPQPSSWTWPSWGRWSGHLCGPPRLPPGCSRSCTSCRNNKDNGNVICSPYAVKMVAIPGKEGTVKWLSLYVWHTSSMETCTHICDQSWYLEGKRPSTTEILQCWRELYSIKLTITDTASWRCRIFHEWKCKKDEHSLANVIS